MQPYSSFLLELVLRSCINLSFYTFELCFKPLSFPVFSFRVMSIDNCFSHNSLLPPIEQFLFFPFNTCNCPYLPALLHVQAQVEDPALLDLRHVILILPVCVCFCSHAKLRCMCSCNRCTFCICHNLLNSELVRSVKAKLYSTVLNRSLSTALYTPTFPLRRAISNLGFLTHLHLLLI